MMQNVMQNLTEVSPNTPTIAEESKNCFLTDSPCSENCKRKILNMYLTGGNFFFLVLLLLLLFGFVFLI